MFSGVKKRDDMGMDRIDTVIGEKTLFEGILTAEGTTRIDGILRGKIVSEGTMIIGETGQVIGDIQAQYILIAGMVKGNITIQERAEITGTGKIDGDIQTKALVIAEGAAFKGNCTMNADESFTEDAEPDTAYFAADDGQADDKI